MKGEPLNDLVWLRTVDEAGEDGTKVLPLRGVGNKVDVVKDVSALVRWMVVSLVVPEKHEIKTI